MSYGPFFQFLFLLLVPVVISRLVSLLTGIVITMAVGRPLLFRSNNIGVDNQHHHQQQQLKKLKVGYCNQLACPGTTELLKNDRLSELPDDILIYILSLLTMKEAGRTSVLSNRWRHLWAFIQTLNFDSCDIIEELKYNNNLAEVEGSRYLRWVDQVVSSCKAPTIDDLKVQFDINYLGSFTDSIDNLFVFAMEKKVKRLQVDLSQSVYNRSSSDSALRHTFNCMSSFSNSLTSLTLAYVNITGEILESFLCNCPALEYLSVEKSETLSSLNVTGESLNLRTLRIKHCYELKQLEIFAPNLVHVFYYGPEINIGFKSTPKLAEVSFGQMYADNLDNICSDLSGSLSQIEALSLLTCSSLGWIEISADGPVFTNLVKLDLKVGIRHDDDLCVLESLLKACPLLHLFKLQIISGDDEEREEEKQEAYTHYHLKVVEIVGFTGFPVDVDIAAFLIESAVSLDKFIIDSRDVLLLGTRWEFDETPERIYAREQAIQLGTNLNPGTELQIL